MELDVETVMQKRIKLRDKRAELRKNYEAVDNPLKELEYQGETWLLKEAERVGVDKFAVTGVGTAFKTKKVIPSCADINVLSDWIMETGNTQVLENRISRTFIKEYREEHKELPPGVSVFEELGMTVRRSAISKGDK
jgi:hypothetical protein